MLVTRRRTAAALTSVVIVAACAGGDTGSIRIAPDVFVSPEDRRTSNEVALLSGTFDVVGITALRRDGERFFLVDNRGREYGTEAEVEEAEQRSSPATSIPRHVAAPKVVDGVQLYVDSKGVIPPPMGATFRGSSARTCAGQGFPRRR